MREEKVKNNEWGTYGKEGRYLRLDDVFDDPPDQTSGAGDPGGRVSGERTCSKLYGG
ncbi:hypothetical protein ACP8HI_22780 [Paenibacillus sp. FA6]|uniref:hypothetical protein n=1 Tax=Paenibacillus sp. FA6 TaxID=3413029 RepID=UPI003F654EB5